MSQAITLEPGDLILTGTPAGVGVVPRPEGAPESRRRDHDRDRRPGRADKSGLGRALIEAKGNGAAVVRPVTIFGSGACGLVAGPCLRPTPGPAACAWFSDEPFGPSEPLSCFAACVCAVRAAERNPFICVRAAWRSDLNSFLSAPALRAALASTSRSFQSAFSVNNPFFTSCRSLARSRAVGGNCGNGRARVGGQLGEIRLRLGERIAWRHPPRPGRLRPGRRQRERWHARVSCFIYRGGGRTARTADE